MARKKVVEKVEEVKNRIIRTSIEMIALYGLSKFNLSGVAMHIGLTKAALYWYFPSKDALIIAITKTVSYAYIEHAQRISDSSLNAAEKLRQIVSIPDNDSDSLMCILPLKLFLDYFSDDNEIRKQIQEGYENYNTILSGVLLDGIEAGLFQINWPPDEFAKYITATIDGIVLQNLILQKNHRLSSQLVVSIIETLISK